MIQAYFFDLDGTLVDTEILWVEAMELLAREHGYPISRDQSLEMVYGVSWPEVYARFRKQFPALRWSLDEMGELLAPHFLRLRDSRDVRIESSIALLRVLAKDHPVAVVSGSYRSDVAAAVAIMDIGGLIHFYLGHEDYHPGKPHPACYLSAAERAGVLPEHCVVFEDSNAGICAAKDAGMYGVALARPGRPVQDYSRADLVMSDLSGFTPEMLLSA
ncbi:MAG TPA: HAD family phosphatase [Candidatus Hydrogenedentes bacterium]|nr:HAD family phosphatase [Candidatus Hydrogenedentota bacterium]